MVGSNSFGSNDNFVGFPCLPRCGCDRAMKMWVSNTVQKRNRKFWKCRSSRNVNSYELFLWDDEIGDYMKHKSANQPFCNKCEILEVKLETITNKLEKDEGCRSEKV